MVLCVPRADWTAYSGFVPAARLPWADVAMLLERGACRPRPARGEVWPPEEDIENPDGLGAFYVQPIPYILIQDAKAPETRLWTYRRGTEQEDRLRDLYSLGVGGHVEAVDLDQAGSPAPGLLAGACRELREEAALQLDPEALLPGYAGILRRDQTAVGRVHLGVVFTIAAAEVPETGDLGRAGLGWFDLHMLLLCRSHFEDWSRCLLEELYGPGQPRHQVAPLPPLPEARLEPLSF